MFVYQRVITIIGIITTNQMTPGMGTPGTPKVPVPGVAPVLGALATALQPPTGVWGPDGTHGTWNSEVCNSIYIILSNFILSYPIYSYLFLSIPIYPYLSLSIYLSIIIYPYLSLSIPIYPYLSLSIPVYPYLNLI